MKTTFRVLLGVAICFLAYVLVDSVLTPINFESARESREAAVVKNLVAIRTAQREYTLQHGHYTANLDSLVIFLKEGTKKELSKQGSLTEKQLADKWTDEKVVRAIEKAKKTGNWKEIDAAGISRDFRRDTITTPLIEALYKGEYDINTIDEILYIPYTDGLKYEAEVNDNYTTSQGIHIPLVEVRAHFNTFLGDQDAQELVNLVDAETQLGHYPGLRIGSIDEPNNLAGNWE
ncbi:MAG: hypothetical protein MJZ89_06325 [Paludibacteraceae bacterium]|nr:hypothetical protein [Paludibacteraceae bacterium]